MAEGSSFPLIYFGLQRSGPGEDIEVLLEHMPMAALLVDARSDRVAAVNFRVTELTAYTRAELKNTELPSLFPDWPHAPGKTLQAQTTEAAELAPAQPPPILLNLNRRNLPPIPVQVQAYPASTRGKRALLIINPVESPLHYQSQLLPPDFWDGLQQVGQALQIEAPQAAMDTLLAAGQIMCEAETLILYRIQESEPALQIYACAGQNSGLPERLSLAELVHLSGMRHWEKGKRPGCAMHRYARTAGYEYLTSVPTGQKGALTGLLALAGKTPTAKDLAAQTARLLASAASAIIQRQALSDSAQAQIDNLKIQVLAKKTLEDRSMEATLRLDPNLNLTYLNAAAEAALGYGHWEALDQPVDRILIGADSLLQAIANAQRGETTFQLDDVRLFRRNGDAFQALARVFPLIQGNRVVEILVLIHDLSEMEQMRLRTQNLENRAQIGEVTAAVAHEVRNPINNISTGLQLLEVNLPTDDPNQATIQRMLQDCDRLAELFKSLLTFSKPAEYEMEPLDLPALLNRLLERLKPRIARANVRCSLKTNANCPPILGDLRALERVFINLINNALNAMEKTGGTLVVRVQAVTTPEGKTILETSVADTGPGIPKEIQERIFLPFFTTERTGTGLGLAIVKRIVTGHKGNIRLDSFPGGTVFTVELPTISPEARGDDDRNDPDRR